jgi:hypothetical protein
MIFLYYAYTGICSLKDGFDLNKSTQSVATAPATAAWTHCHISIAASNWFDEVYLNPICLDLTERPRFTKSGWLCTPMTRLHYLLIPRPPLHPPTSRLDQTPASTRPIILVFFTPLFSTPQLPLSARVTPFLLISYPPLSSFPPSCQSVLHTHTSKTGYCWKKRYQLSPKSS